MKKIRHIGIVCMCLFFVLSIAVYSFNTSTAKGAVSFSSDILPLFTQSRAWHDIPDSGHLATLACGSCHFSTMMVPGNFHMMDLTTHAGWLSGSDGGENPLLGETDVGETDYEWEGSMLNKRVRDNRMPPGFPFQFPSMMGDPTNRNGPDLVRKRFADANDVRLRKSRFAIKVDADGDYEYGSAVNAVGLIAAWVEGTDAGLRKRANIVYGGVPHIKWKDIRPLFTQQGAWFVGSLACTYCHAGDVNDDGEEDCPNECHLMDLSSPAGLRAGADGGTEPLLGEGFIGFPPFDWAASELRWRLRNNRMPPNAPFVVDESNRDGRTQTHPDTSNDVSAVELIGEWVGDGAPDN